MTQYTTAHGCRKQLPTLLTRLLLSALLSLWLLRSADAQALYVSEYFTRDIYCFSLNGENLGVFATLNTEPYERGGRMAFGPDNNLFVTGQGQMIYRLSPAGADLGIFCTLYFAQMASLAFDSSGYLYTADFYSNRVVRISPTGTAGEVVGHLNRPIDVIPDPVGNLYVCEYGSGRILRFSSTGANLGVFASGLQNPNQMTFDQAGNLYVLQPGLNTIRKFSPTGVDLGNFATTGLNEPGDLKFGPDGNLYVSNYGVRGLLSTIRKFSPEGLDLGDFATGLCNPNGLAFGPLPPHTTKSEISGRIHYEGCADAARTVILTFRRPDGPQTISCTYTITLEADGSFHLPDMACHDYTVHIQSGRQLTKNIRVDARNGDVSVNVTLLGGDTNGDNVVDVFDLDALIQAFNTLPGEGSWNARADFNEDGSVDIFDLDIVIRSFNIEGDE